MTKSSSTDGLVEHYLAASRRSEKRSGWILVTALLLVVIAGGAAGWANKTVARQSSSITSLGSSIHSLTVQLHKVQKKSSEQTRAEIQLRHDVTELTGVAGAQSKVIATYNSGSTRFFELLRELLVAGSHAQNDKTAHGRRAAFRSLNRVERALARFRFPHSGRSP